MPAHFSLEPKFWKFHQHQYQHNINTRTVRLFLHANVLSHEYLEASDALADGAGAASNLSPRYQASYVRKNSSVGGRLWVALRFYHVRFISFPIYLQSTDFYLPYCRKSLATFTISLTTVFRHFRVEFQSNSDRGWCWEG